LLRSVSCKRIKRRKPGCCGSDPVWSSSYATPIHFRPMPHDIFISYRRGGGADNARLLLSELQKRGYSVFLDVEGLQDGHFDESLLKHIEESPNFILVLSLGSVDRCRNEGDWLRREIAHAIKTRRRIIPVMVPEFKFPSVSELPEELRDLPRHHGVSHSHELFSATLEKICALLGEPRVRQSVGGSARRFRNALIGTGVGLLSGLTAIALWAAGMIGGKSLTIADETLLRGVATDIAAQHARVNVELGSVEDTVRLARKHFANPHAAAEAGQTNELSAWARQHLVELDQVKLQPFWEKSYAAKLQEQGIPAEDVHAFYTSFLPRFWTEAHGFYERTLYYAELQPDAWLNDPIRVVEISAGCLSLKANAMYYGALSLFSHFPPKTVDGFEKTRPVLTRLPDAGLLSTQDAEALMNKAMTQYEEKARELATLVGNEAISLEVDRKTLSLLQQKAAGVAKMEETLKEYDAHLAASRSAIREKCRLAPADDPAFMWGKILRLHTVKMTNDVLSALNQYVQFNKDRNPHTEAYVAGARAFFQNPTWSTNDAGVLVALTENNQPHSFIKIGDVLLEWNGQRLRVSDDFVKAPKPPVGEGSKFILLRVTSTGELQEMTGQSKTNDPRVAVADLRELDEGNGSSDGILKINQ
jgi:hypothetical protein